VKLPPSLKLFLLSAGAGTIGAIALGVIAYALAPLFDAVGMYIMPARLLVPVVGRIIPSRLMYQLVPDGGAAAGLLLILASAVLFWTVSFGAIYFAWATSRRKQAPREAIGL
jgi:hypothetical protein